MRTDLLGQYRREAAFAEQTADGIRAHAADFAFNGERARWKSPPPTAGTWLTAGGRAIGRAHHAPGRVPRVFHRSLPRCPCSWRRADGDSATRREAFSTLLEYGRFRGLDADTAAYVTGRLAEDFQASQSTDLRVPAGGNPPSPTPKPASSPATPWHDPREDTR